MVYVMITAMRQSDDGTFWAGKRQIDNRLLSQNDIKQPQKHIASKIPLVSMKNIPLTRQ